MLSIPSSVFSVDGGLQNTNKIELNNEKIVKVSVASYKKVYSRSTTRNGTNHMDDGNIPGNHIGHINMSKLVLGG